MPFPLRVGQRSFMHFKVNLDFLFEFKDASVERDIGSLQQRKWLPQTQIKANNLN